MQTIVKFKLTSKVSPVVQSSGPVHYSSPAIIHSHLPIILPTTGMTHADTALALNAAA